MKREREREQRKQREAKTAKERWGKKEEVDDNDDGLKTQIKDSGA